MGSELLPILLLVSFVGLLLAGIPVAYAAAVSGIVFGFIGFGTTSSGFPLCGCTLVHEYTALLFGNQLAFPIPNNPIFAGAQIYIQGVDLDLLAAPGCLGLPPFTVSDGYQFTVQ